MKLKVLVGSGDRIGLWTLPVLVIGAFANLWRPHWFTFGGPSPAWRLAAVAIMVPGIFIWLWSVSLILIRVPRGELITDGPYTLVKHPLYTSVSLLVLPWAGILLDTWLGVLVGVVLYLASRRFAPDEEAQLARAFGSAWDTYCERVWLRWL